MTSTRILRCSEVIRVGATVVVAAVTVSAACATKVTADDDDGIARGGAGGSPDVSNSTSDTASSTTTSTTTTVTTVTTATTVTATTSSGACDNGIPGDISSAVCTACITCAQTNECQFETTTCANNPDCTGYEQCRGNCFTMCDVNVNNTIDPNEEPCFNGSCHGDLTLYFNDPNYVPPSTSCLGLYGSGNKTGPDDYWNMLSCWICLACPINCNAAQNCA